MDILKHSVTFLLVVLISVLIVGVVCGVIVKSSPSDPQGINFIADFWETFLLLSAGALIFRAMISTYMAGAIAIGNPFKLMGYLIINTTCHILLIVASFSGGLGLLGLLFKLAERLIV
jgi:hypothetical protein